MPKTIVHITRETGYVIVCNGNGCSDEIKRILENNQEIMRRPFEVEYKSEAKLREIVFDLISKIPAEENVFEVIIH